MNKNQYFKGIATLRLTIKADQLSEMSSLALQAFLCLSDDKDREKARRLLEELSSLLKEETKT